MADETTNTGNWFKRHKWLTIIGIIVLIIIISSAGGSKDDSANNSNSETNESANTATEEESTDQAPASGVAKIGEPARDGKFEFTVNSMKCGETKVGSNEYLQDTATGHFCRVNMTIKNIGNEAQSLFADNQKLVDSQNREYSYDSSATIYAAPSGTSGTWYDQINPGNSVTGDVLYDVPKDVTPVTAILHDSAFSGGVKVSLQ